MASGVPWVRVLKKSPRSISPGGWGGKGGVSTRRSRPSMACERVSAPSRATRAPSGVRRGGGIETKVKPFHGFLGTFVDHPGGPESLHVATGPPLLLPEIRIGRIAWLGIPQAIPMIGQGKGRRKLPPELPKVDGPPPEDLEIVRGRFFQMRDELGNGRKVEIGGESCKGPVAGGDQRHDISLRSQGHDGGLILGRCRGAHESPGLLPSDPAFLTMISDHWNKCRGGGILASPPLTPPGRLRILLINWSIN